MDLKPLRRLPKAVTLGTLKAMPLFADSPLVRQGRLSVVPLTAAQWKAIEREGGAMSRLVVLCTVGKAEDAEWIAREVVERRLAACVNVVPAVTSIYRWRGEVEKNEEILLVIKTRSERFEALREAIVSMHSSEVPEVIALAVEAGHRPLPGVARRRRWETEGLYTAARAVSKVGEKVVRVFAADADPHQAVPDPQGVALGLRVARVGHRGRVRDQRLDAAQALPERAEPHRPQEAVRGLAGARGRRR